MIQKRHAVLGVTALLLAGCTGLDVDAVRKMPTTGNAFQTALHKE